MFGALYGAILIHEENENDDENNVENDTLEPRVIYKELRDVSNPFAYDDEYFRQHYR